MERNIEGVGQGSSHDFLTSDVEGEVGNLKVQ
jgi:hypothetical protein